MAYLAIVFVFNKIAKGGREVSEQSAFNVTDDELTARTRSTGV